MPVTNDDKDNIDQPSDDQKAMLPYYTLSNDIVDGIEAMRSKGKEYLPRFPAEPEEKYKFRLATATMTNIYRDIVEDLSMKPFVEMVKTENMGRTEAIVEDIDGRGNHLHSFLAETFFSGINNSVHWILIDYPNVGNNIRTIADENVSGARPYWVHVHALNILEVRTRIIMGKEQIVYLRMLEYFEGEEQVRVFDKTETQNVEWRVYKKEENQQNSHEWVLDASGELQGVDRIPVVPFITGRRKGTSWKFRPPMNDLADSQKELYQKETNLKEARTLTCFPMLAGNGVTPSKDDSGQIQPITVGPNSVLYAPMNDDGKYGSWERLEADAASLKFLRDDIDAHIQQMREIGRQPLTAQSSNITRISAAISAGKGDTIIEAWVNNLKDVAELACQITNQWYGEAESDPVVIIYKDFINDLGEEDTTPNHLLTMRANGDLSRETLYTEMQRRKVLSPDFDKDEEVKKLLNEVGDGSPEQDDIDESVEDELENEE